MRLPRTPVADLIEGLREDAENLSLDLVDIPPHETTEGQAAQALEEFETALRRIAEGAPEPRTIAEDALSLSAPLKPIGDADDTIRGLLKPRRG